jgi:tetratricopeptide (TPR) repeat protein
MSARVHGLALAVVAVCSCGGPSPRQLLARGDYRAVLARVRPVGGEAHRWRGAAYLGLGQLKQAQRALRLALALDPDDLEVLRISARVDVKLGARGAALAALQRAFARSLEQPRRARLLYARLLAERVALRRDPRRRIGDLEAAYRDEQLLRRLAPSVRPPSLPKPGPGDGGGCSGPPTSLPVKSRAGPPRCRLEDAARRLHQLRRRDLLLSCFGAQTALSLERAGCRATALVLWRALQREQPRDPRWPLQVGRSLLAAGGARGAAARVAFESHVYLSAATERARAALRVAEVQRLAGRSRHAAAWAIKSQSLAMDDAQRLAALKLLGRLEQPRILRQAARAARVRSPALGPAIDALLNAPRRTPAR